VGESGRLSEIGAMSVVPQSLAADASLVEYKRATVNDRFREAAQSISPSP
jgi:hypothetical protein